MAITAESLEIDVAESQTRDGAEIGDQGAIGGSARSRP